MSQTTLKTMKRIHRVKAAVGGACNAQLAIIYAFIHPLSSSDVRICFHRLQHDQSTSSSCGKSRATDADSRSRASGGGSGNTSQKATPGGDGGKTKNSTR